jgi:hypothetical protein
MREWQVQHQIKENVMDHIVNHIIAGRFQTKSKADAAAKIITCYVDRRDICIFHNNPPGQHGVLPMGGDEESSPGADRAQDSSATTAIAAGLVGGAIGLAGGPVTALAAASVAAYTGSLLGMMEGANENAPPGSTPVGRPAGVILAVRIALPANEEIVIDDLRLGGAEDIEEADGEWRDSNWVDFNPIQPPRLIAG